MQGKDLKAAGTRDGEHIMRLKNVLIVVKDIEKSRQFYHDLFGLDVLVDNDGNMTLTEGLVLQDEKIWRQFVELPPFLLLFFLLFFQSQCLKFFLLL